MRATGTTEDGMRKQSRTRARQTRDGMDKGGPILAQPGVEKQSKEWRQQNKSARQKQRRVFILRVWFWGPTQLAWPAGMDPLLALACLGMGRVLRGTSHKNRNRLALIIITTTRCHGRRRCAELYFSMQISPLFGSFFVCQTSDLNGSRTPRPTRPQTTSEVVTPLLYLAVGTSLLTLVKRPEPGRLLQLQPNMARRWP